MGSQLTGTSIVGCTQGCIKEQCRREVTSQVCHGKGEVLAVGNISRNRLTWRIPGLKHKGDTTCSLYSCRRPTPTRGIETTEAVVGGSAIHIEIKLVQLDVRMCQRINVNSPESLIRICIPSNGNINEQVVRIVETNISGEQPVNGKASAEEDTNEDVRKEDLFFILDLLIKGCLPTSI
jgi:hypothetical protein